jgi:hypothetical protein
MARCALPVDVVLDLDAAGLVGPDARTTPGFGRHPVHVIEVAQAMADWCRTQAARLRVSDPPERQRYLECAEKIETALSWEDSDRGPS